MPTPVKDWGDFESFVRDYIPRQTIPTLRRFSEILESYTGNDLALRSTDKKANIVQKVEYGFRDLKASNRLETYRNVRQNCESIGLPTRMNYTSPTVPTFGGVPHPSSSSSSFMGHSAAGLPSAPYRAPTSAYAPSTSRPNGSGWATASSVSNVYQSHGSGPNHQLMDWKKNPMWRPIKAMSGMELLPDIDSNQKNHMRRERRLAFNLPPDVADKLRSSKGSSVPPHYSLRLFCASSDHYRPTSAPYTASTAHIRNIAIPIEYPSNPDVSIDYQNVPFKQRGLRGKPGSAPPLDLGSSANGLSLNTGRMTSFVFGHTGPTSKKKEDWKRFWFQIVLAEVHTKDELLSRLVKLNPTSAEDSIAEAKKRLEGDDIELGTSTMTLKDPLSYMRITRPVRSSKCSHIQCFDATWWIESNANHPMWQCPLCNKELQFDDLIVDGYFFNILNSVPDSVEEVVVEHDFEWHTEDNTYGSSKWMGGRPTTNGVFGVNGTNGANGFNGVYRANGAGASPEDTKPRLSPEKASTPPDRKGKRKAIEILSSDDEDEVPLRRTSFPNGTLYQTSESPPPRIPSMPVLRPALALPRPAPTRTPSIPRAPPPPDTSVIDLTADSDDEDDVPLAPPMQTSNTASSSSSSQGSHFRLPGAGSTMPAVSESIRPTLAPLPNRPVSLTTTTSVTSPVSRPVSGSGRVESGGVEATGVRQNNGNAHGSGGLVSPNQSRNRHEATDPRRRWLGDRCDAPNGNGLQNGFGNYSRYSGFSNPPTSKSSWSQSPPFPSASTLAPGPEAPSPIHRPSTTIPPPRNDEHRSSLTYQPLSSWSSSEIPLYEEPRPPRPAYSEDTRSRPQPLSPPEFGTAPAYGTALTGGGHWSPGQLTPDPSLDSVWATGPTREDSYRPNTFRPNDPYRSRDDPRPNSSDGFGVSGGGSDVLDYLGGHAIFKKRASASDWMDEEYYPPRRDDQ